MKRDEFTVYVPAEGRFAQSIDPRSGIVGADDPQDGRVLVYFEGNRYRAANMVSYADRCHHAAGRARESYPTTAMMSLPVEAVIPVGTYYYGYGRLEPAGGWELVQIAKWLSMFNEDTMRIEPGLDREFFATHAIAARMRAVGR